MLITNVNNTYFTLQIDVFVHVLVLYIGMILDDGKLMMEIVETDNEAQVKARVIQGGPFKSKKGVNLPNTDVSLPALTEKDIKSILTRVLPQGQGS